MTHVINRQPNNSFLFPILKHPYPLVHAVLDNIAPKRPFKSISKLYWMTLRVHTEAF